MNRTAVVVDDTPEVGHQLAGILTRLGLDVIAVCESGSEGLRTILMAQPTIATIDIQMPDMNGLEVVTAARLAHVPTKLVVCSGTKQQQVREQARAAGAVAFIIKPYDQVLVARDLGALLKE